MLTFLVQWIAVVALAYSMFRFGFRIGYQRALNDVIPLLSQIDDDVPLSAGVRGVARTSPPLYGCLPL